MKFSLKKYNLKPLFILAVFASFTLGCEEENMYEDNVPDYTYSIIRSFEVNGQAAEINHTNGVIATTLAAGTALSSVSVEMTLPDGATVDPSSGSSVDFTNGPVIFTVSNNGVSREYTATINAYGTPEMTSFSIGETTGAIDQQTGDITIKVTSLADIRSLTPLFTIPAGATASPKSGIIQDFSNPFRYKITSDDGFTGKTYTVHVDQYEKAEISEFKSSEDACSITGVIDNDALTIMMNLPAGSSLSAVAPIIVVPDGCTISPASGEAQDFSQGAVTYAVTNSEEITTEYSVTVQNLDSTNKVVFLGEADCVNTLLDDDAKAAAEYLKAQYPSDFAYMKIADVTEAALANTNVVMLYYLTPVTDGVQYAATPDNVMTMLPAELQPGAAQSTAITNWAKAGGNMFLAGDPTPFIHVMGRMPADYSAPRALGNYRFTEFGCAGPGGCVDFDKPADDIWGLGVRDANNSGNRRTHPIFDGLTFNGDGELPLSNSGTREARLVWHQHMDGVLSPGCCGQDAALLFEQTTTAIKLGTLRWIGDAFGYGAVEYLPTNGTNHSNFDTNIPTDFGGSVIVLANTIIGYEFNSNEGRPNDYQGNIEQLTSNIINHLNQ